jgi:hypothetical protein
MINGFASCLGSNRCVIVGGTEYTGSSKTEVGRHTSSGWHFSTGASGSGFLSDVKCLSTDWCMAVGWRENSGTTSTKALAERWNGSSWSTVPMPSTSEQYTVPEEVSCTSKDSCMAVGQKLNASSYARALFAERWNGTSWSLVGITTPTYPNAKVYTVPNEVTCDSSTCYLVGYYHPLLSGRAPQFPFLESWNGSSWSLRKLPKSVLSSFQWFNDISCLSTTNCWIVGTGTASNTGPAAAAVHYDGSAFSAETTPRPGTNSQLDAVGCVANADCVAIGAWSKTLSTPPYTTTWHVLGERISDH